MPVISNLVYTVTDTTIVATWTTDVSSDSNFTATGGAFPGGKPAIDNGLAPNSTSHQCVVTGLDPNTQYSCVVTSGGSSSSPQNKTTNAAQTRTPITAVKWCGTNTVNPTNGDSVSTFVSNDNNSYTIMNDGFNWGGNGNSNMMIGKLTDELYLRGVNVNGLSNFGVIANCTGTDGPGGNCMTNKAFGIFGMAGDLYVCAARQFGYTDLHGNIIKSQDKGATWNCWQNPATFNAGGVLPSPLGSFQWDSDSIGCMMPVRYAVDDGTMGYNTAGNQIDGANGFWYFTYQNAPGYVNNNNLFLARCPRITIQLQTASALQYWHGPASPTPADFVNDTNWTSSSTGATAIYSQVNGFGFGGVSWDDLTFIPALNRYFLINWYYPTGQTVGTWTSVKTAVWEFLEAPTPAGPWTSVGTMTHFPTGYFSPSVMHRTAATNTQLTNIILKAVYSGDYVAGTYYHPAIGTLVLNPQGMADPTMAFVQATDNGASVNTATATFSANITQGSAIVVTGRFFTNTNRLVVTDTLGNIYLPVGMRGTGRSGAWVALNSPGGACTITISNNSGTNFQIVACEYSGVAAVRGIEWSQESQIAATATTAYNVGSVNTLNANDLIVGWFVDNTNNATTFTAGTDFTLRKTATTGAVCVEDYTLPLAGAHQVNINTSATNQQIDGGGIVLSATPVLSPVTFNRTFGGQAAGSTSIVSAAFKVSSGNNIVVAIGIGNGHDPATSVTSVTDTAGNTYTAITNAHASASTSGTQFYLATNVTGHVANVITAALTGSWPNTSLFAWEVVGSVTANPVDQAVGKTGTSTTPNLNAFTPTQDNELILVSAHQFFGGNNPFTPTGGYNYELNSPYPSPWAVASTDQIAAAESTMQKTAASTTPSFTTTHNVAWSMAAVSLIAAPVPPPSTGSGKGFRFGFKFGFGASQGL